ncbi:MAG: HAD hydrolase family protein, partial [Clostridia bacterium]|nr:HAD hydrolase family protein [Clostridia bacterium]
MLQMIISDIDGTLLKSGEPLDPEIFRLIRFFKERGVLFCACSGRPLSNLLRIFAPVRDEIYCVAENGTLLWADNELTCLSHIDRALGQAVMKKALENPDCDILLATRDMSYTQTENKEYIHYVRDVIDYDLTVVDDILSLPVDYIKIAICNFKGIRNSFDDFFKDFASGPLSVVTSGNIWLDMIPKEINKG